MGLEIVYPQNAPQLICASVLKRVLKQTFLAMRSNYFKMNLLVKLTHFHMNGIARRLILAQRKKEQLDGNSLLAGAITPPVSTQRSLRDDLKSRCVDHRVYQSYCDLTVF